VTDEQGDPVPSARVFLLQQQVTDGVSGVQQLQEKETSATGAFHFSQLPSGAYFLAVVARPWYAQNPPYMSRGTTDATSITEAVKPPADLDVAYPVTYSGGATDGNAAQPIVLGEGDSITTQINLRAVPSLHIPVTGISNETGGGFGGGLFASGPSGVPIFTQAMFSPTTLPSGSSGFEINGVAPGHYELQLQTGHRQVPTGGRQSVDLAEGSTVSIATTSMVAIQGEVTFEGAVPKGGFVVVLTNGQQSNAGQIQADGSFVLQNLVPPGHHAFAIVNAPGFSIKSISAKGANGSGDTLDIPANLSGPLQVSIIAAPVAVTELDGIVLQDGKPVPGTMVLLLPEDLSRTLAIRRDQSDSDGTFTLSEIPAGRYHLLAIDDGSSLAYQNAAVMKGYLARAQEITFPAHIDGPMRVTVQPRQP